MKKKDSNYLNIGAFEFRGTLNIKDRYFRKFPMIWMKNFE